MAVVVAWVFTEVHLLVAASNATPGRRAITGMPWRRYGGPLSLVCTPSSWPRPLPGLQLRFRVGRWLDRPQLAGQEEGWRAGCAGRLQHRAGWAHGCGPKSTDPASRIGGGSSRSRHSGGTAVGGRHVQLPLHIPMGARGSTPGTPGRRPARRRWGRALATEAGEKLLGPGEGQSPGAWGPGPKRQTKFRVHPRGPAG